MSLPPILFIAITFVLSFYVIKSDIMEFVAAQVEFNNGTDSDQLLANNGEFDQLYYYLSKDNFPYLFLRAGHLVILHNNQEIQFDQPRGYIFNNLNNKIFYEASSGSINQEIDKKIILEKNVKIWDEKGHMKGQWAYYDINKSFFHMKKDVKAYMITKSGLDNIYVNSDEALNWNTEEKQITHFLGNTRGKILRTQKNESIIHFRSVNAYADSLKSYIELKNDVRLQKGELRAKGQYCEIYLENLNKKIKYYVLHSDVKVLEKVYYNPLKKGDFFLRRAYGEHLEGIMGEKKMILTGYPKVLQNKDVIKGNKITIFENNEVVEVDDSNSSFEVK